MSDNIPPSEQWSCDHTDTDPLYQYQATESESLTQAVLAALTDADEIDTNQTPLYEVIDPDALSSLFNHETQRGRIAFRYDSTKVVVSSNGQIKIYRDTEN